MHKCYCFWLNQPENQINSNRQTNTKINKQALETKSYPPVGLVPRPPWGDPPNAGAPPNTGAEPNAGAPPNTDPTAEGEPKGWAVPNPEDAKIKKFEKALWKPSYQLTFHSSKVEINNFFLCRKTLHTTNTDHRYCLIVLCYDFISWICCHYFLLKVRHCLVNEQWIGLIKG